MTNQKIFEHAKEIYPELIQVRRHLHKNPELSFREYKTAEFIEQYLSNLQIPTRRIAETGIIGIVGKGKTCIAFRADIDALPIEEHTKLDFASNNSGIMHACGHDIHTATLLGTARILKQSENELSVQVKLIFQPGEEKLPGGATKLIELGALDNPEPVAIFAQHTDPDTEVGKIAINSGYIMASADELYWTLRGKGSHAAQPHYGNDAILAAANIVTNIQSITNKFKNPLSPAIISITSINGGSATNIFPDEVKLMGTLRTFDNTLRNQLLKKIEEFSKEIAKLYGVECQFSPLLGYPPLKNDYEMTNIVAQNAADLLGKENVIRFEPKMWAEDFAYYSNKIPAVFWFNGVRPKNYSGEFFGLHSPKYNPDEEAIIYGIAMFVKIAFAFK